MLPGYHGAEGANFIQGLALLITDVSISYCNMSNRQVADSSTFGNSS
jgi:hypothetical protein